MLSQNLQLLRKKHNLTQEKLANILNVKKHTIGDWETNRSEPSIEMLKKLAKYYDISIDSLLEHTFSINTNNFSQQKKYIRIKPNTLLEENIINLIKSFNSKQLTIINNLLENTDSFKTHIDQNNQHTQ